MNEERSHVSAKHLWIPRRRVAILQALTALVAIAALAGSVLLYANSLRVDQRNTCRLLHGFINTAVQSPTRAKAINLRAHRHGFC